MNSNLSRCLSLLENYHDKESVERCLSNRSLWRDFLFHLTGLSLPEKLSQATPHQYCQLYEWMKKNGHPQCQKELISLLVGSLSSFGIEKKLLWKPCQLFIHQLEEEEGVEWGDLNDRFMNTLYRSGGIVLPPLSRDFVMKSLMEKPLLVLRETLSRLSSSSSQSFSQGKEICDSFYILMSLSHSGGEEYHPISDSFSHHYGTC